MSGSCYYIALRSVPDICDICEVHHYFVSFVLVRVSEKKTRELCLPFCELGREMSSYKHSRSTTFTFNSNFQNWSATGSSKNVGKCIKLVIQIFGWKQFLVSLKLTAAEVGLSYVSVVLDIGWPRQL